MSHWLLCAFVPVFTATELGAETTIYVGQHFEVRGTWSGVSPQKSNFQADRQLSNLSSDNGSSLGPDARVFNPITLEFNKVVPLKFDVVIIPE